MKTLIKENTWLNRGGVLQFGWGNGYVIIPPGHKLHGVDHDNIGVDIHGGLTFSELIDEESISYWPELSKSDLGSWIIGFDTAHAWDTLERWPKEAVQAEAERLKEQLLNL